MINYPRKLTTVDWKVMSVHSFKLFFSGAGLLMIGIIILFGGGVTSLLMRQITTQGVGFLIVEQAIITIYFVCLLARYRSGNTFLPVSQEIRNIIINLLVGVAVTTMLLFILFAVRIYFPLAHTIETQVGIANTASHSSLHYVQAKALNSSPEFPRVFNIFSIVTFFVLSLLPFVAIIIGCLMNSTTTMHRSLGSLFLGIFLNTNTMILLSVFNISMMGVWSFSVVKNESFVFFSAPLLAYISTFSYVAAEQIYQPDKCLLKHGNAKGTFYTDDPRG